MADEVPSVEELLALGDLEKQTAAQIKVLLKKCNLPVTGVKAALIERLTAYISERQAQEKESAQSDQSTEKPTAPKAPEITTTKSTVNVTNVSAANSLISADAKLKRAERFGIQNAETKKVERAKRFGITAPETGAASAGAIDEAKRKRAERFGIPVVPADSGRDSQAGKTITPMTPELQAKIEKRKARFGVVEAETSSSAVNGTPGRAVIPETSEIAAKKAKRAERFGLVA